MAIDHIRDTWRYSRGRTTLMNTVQFVNDEIKRLGLSPIPAPDLIEHFKCHETDNKEVLVSHAETLSNIRQTFRDLRDIRFSVLVGNIREWARDAKGSRDAIPFDVALCCTKALEAFQRVYSVVASGATASAAPVVSGAQEKTQESSLGSLVVALHKAAVEGKYTAGQPIPEDVIKGVQSVYDDIRAAVAAQGSAAAAAAPTG